MVLWRGHVGSAVAAGGIQFVDFVSDVVVVATWYGDGKWELFWAAVAFMLVSLAMAWMMMALETWEDVKDSLSLPGKVAMYVVLPVLNLHVLAYGLLPGCDRSNFFAFKVLETMLESVPMSVLMVMDLAWSRSGGGGGGGIPLVTASSLGVSVLSMAVGIAAQTVTRNDELHGAGLAAETFVLCLADVVWLLAAYGVCLSTAGAQSYLAPACVLGVQFLGFAYVVIKKSDGPGDAAFLILLLGMPFTLFDPCYLEAEAFWAPGVIVRRLGLVAVSAVGISYSDFGGGAGVWAPWAVMGVLALAHSYLSLRFYHSTGNIEFDVGKLLPSLGGCLPARVWPSGEVEAPPGEGGGAGPGGQEEAEEWLRGMRDLPGNVWGEEWCKRFADVAEAVLWYRGGKTEGALRMGDGTEAEVRRVIGKVVELVTGGVDGGEAGGGGGAEKGKELALAATEVLGEYHPAGEGSHSRFEEGIKRLLGGEGGGGTMSAGEELAMDTAGRGEGNESGVMGSGAGGGGHSLPANGDLEGGEGGGFGFRQLPMIHAAEFWVWQSKEGSKATSDLSVELEGDEMCKTFVSHSWSDSWYLKISQLRADWLLLELDATVLIMTVIGVLLVLPLGFLWEGFTEGGGVWYILPCIVALCGVACYLWAHLSGIVFPASRGPWGWKGLGGVWLDKCCIDQTDDKSKQAGIARLGEHLARCETMTVMLGETYLSRLWCTYELAMFCRMHLQQGEGGSSNVAPEALDGGGEDGSSVHSQQGEGDPLDGKIRLLSLGWWGSMNPVWLFREAKLSKRESGLLANYSCRNARCFLPKDRATVLSAIRKEWGSEEVFDAFVRKEFRELLRRGKERFMRRPGEVMVEVLSELF